MVVFRDVSERKKAENAIRESEEKFRNLAEESPNMIFINQMGKVVYANKKCEEAMGYTREEFYNPDFNFLKLIAPEYRKMIGENLKKHNSGKELLPYEYELITKEGKRIESIITTKLISYGGEKALLGIITDITEWKKAEKELKESEEKFKNIANRSSDVIVVTNEKGIIDYISPSVEKISDIPQKDCIGKSFFKFIYKTDIPRVTKHFNQTIKNYKDIENFPLKIKGRSDKAIYGEISATPIIDNGKVIGTQGVIRDMTEYKIAEQRLRESEENYRNIVELAPDGIITVNTKGVVNSCNTAFSKLSGYSKDEIIGVLRPLGLQNRRVEILQRLAVELVVLGRVPSKAKELTSLPGVGHYCSSAVRCLVFGEADPMVDGSVVRIVNRVFSILDRTQKCTREKGVKVVHDFLEESLEEDNVRDFNFGLLDFAFTFCKSRKTLCYSCPLNDICDASGLQ